MPNDIITNIEWLKTDIFLSFDSCKLENSSGKILVLNKNLCHKIFFKEKIDKEFLERLLFNKEVFIILEIFNCNKSQIIVYYWNKKKYFQTSPDYAKLICNKPLVKEHINSSYSIH